MLGAREDNEKDRCKENAIVIAREIADIGEVIESQKEEVSS